MRPVLIVFDVNETLLDLVPLQNTIAEFLDGKPELVSLWFSTMLHHSLVLSAAGKYEHFGEIGAAALKMVAASQGKVLDLEQCKSIIISGLRKLSPHPDVKEALSLLKNSGYQLASFTNSSLQGVQSQFDNAGLTPYFDEILSVEQAGVFKPFTTAYEWLSKTMGLHGAECMMVAAHGWDVAGAKWAGWQTTFVQRPGKQLFPLAPKPNFVVPDLRVFAEKMLS